jgi:hypothetical protein
MKIGCRSFTLDGIMEFYRKGAVLGANFMMDMSWMAAMRAMTVGPLNRHWTFVSYLLRGNPKDVL